MPLIVTIVVYELQEAVEYIVGRAVRIHFTLLLREDIIIICGNGGEHIVEHL